MILELLKYPDERIRLISGNVRHFDDTLQSILTDMRDTMQANNLEALSAMQIGIQYAVILIKEGENYKPYINLRILSKSGKITQTERSPYYENISVDVIRHEKIKIFYEDETGTAQYADVEGDFSCLLQHQLDYNYGSTFVDRVDKETKLRIGDHLSQGLVKSSSSCPTHFYRDDIIRGYKLLMLSVLIGFFISFFLEPSQIKLLENYNAIALGVTLLLIIVYPFYAYYEAQQYKQCTSCQTGNIIGTAGIALVQWFILLAINYFYVAI